MKKTLKQKGWNEQEIKHAEAILHKEQKHDAHFSKIVFWSALVTIIFANLLVSLVLIPFLIVLAKLVLYAIIALLAGVVGCLYKFLVMDIGHLERKYHQIAAVLIPLIALANIFATVLVSNKFIESIDINLPPHNPWIGSIVFAVAFIIPYLAHEGRRLLRRNSTRS